jgi:hypothetical protein
MDFRLRIERRNPLVTDRTACPFVLRAELHERDTRSRVAKSASLQLGNAIGRWSQPIVAAPPTPPNVLRRLTRLPTRRVVVLTG